MRTRPSRVARNDNGRRMLSECCGIAAPLLRVVRRRPHVSGVAGGGTATRKGCVREVRRVMAGGDLSNEVSIDTPTGATVSPRTSSLLHIAVVTGLAAVRAALMSICSGAVW